MHGYQRTVVLRIDNKEVTVNTVRYHPPLMMTHPVTMGALVQKARALPIGAHVVTEADLRQYKE